MSADTEERDVDISKALHILATVHTKDDAELGFAVQIGARGPEPWDPFSQAEYVEAWKAVRERAHMQTEPAEGDQPTSAPK